MKKDNILQKTVNYYDQHAEEWAQAKRGYEEGSYWGKEMQMFKRLLPSGKILEIGSGTGKDAKVLIRLGYEYIGIDASIGMLDIAKKRNPGANLQRMSALNLEFPDNHFDGFWTAATLLHIPKDSVGKVLENIAKVVKPNGTGFISMKEGGKEAEDKETGRGFSYYSRQEFENLLKESGFEVIEYKSKSGEKDFWMIFFVKVRK